MKKYTFFYLFFNFVYSKKDIQSDLYDIIYMIFLL